MLKILILYLFTCAFLFAGRDISKHVYTNKKSSIDLFAIQTQEKTDTDKKLERKRSHKRRRKIRKPIKGLR